MSDFSVELVDVNKQFTDPAGNLVYAVDQVSLQVKEGEFFSLLGPSGCGKTTTLRMIAGFEYPTSGEILLHGKEMGQTPPYKRPVNTVFQHYALFPHMSVGQNVGFGLEMSGVEKKDIGARVKEALTMVRLTGMEERKPKQLSGGQQQRVAVARALINHPEVLLLDEPLGALDLKLRKEMQLELKTIQREVGITFIYVTHDQEEALTMSDRIAVMNGGRVLQVGTPEEIYEEPSTRFVAEFIGETNFLVGKVTTQNGSLVEINLPDGQKVVAVSDARLEKGSEVTVTVRCERITLKSDEGHANQFSGQVDEIVYIGTDTYYGVRLKDGQRVRVREQNADPTQRVIARLGDPVVISCQAEAARALGD
ncbi:MAG TPA: ABC transporter ATP-binding protein [Anaerolineales bacterium]|nr:ABC transporter ATP-binding protein [Anaerolineales bacterium]